MHVCMHLLRHLTLTTTASQSPTYHHKSSPNHGLGTLPHTSFSSESHKPLDQIASQSDPQP
jgi:hypothetical protein